MKRTELSRNLLALTVLLATTVFATAPAQAAPKFNVKAFGATGNGVTDDTAAILQAIAAANAVPGSTLQFPVGNYLYSSVLPANGINVTGQPAILTSANNSATLQLSGTGDSVRNMIFASQSSGSTAVTVNQANGFQIIGNTFTKTVNHDVSARNSSNGLIQSNTISLAGGGTAIEVLFGNQISILGNSIAGTNGGTGIDCGVITNLIILSNKLSNLGTCIETGASIGVKVLQNSCSNFSQGMNSGVDTNVSITGNRLVGNGSGLGLQIGAGTNVLFSNNLVQSVSTGLQSGVDSNMQITGNTFLNVQNQALSLGADQTPIVSFNSMSHVGQAVSMIVENNATVSGNHISQCQQQAIFANGCQGTLAIANNNLSDSGLAALNPAAVIFVDCPGATSIPITGNTYKGNTANLQYFIDSVQPEPPAQVSGNFTNTFLPNKIGP